MDQIAPANIEPDPRSRLLPFIRDLRARSRMLVDAARIRLGELKPIAAHIRQHMQVLQGNRSRANLVYAFGAVVEREAYLDLDDLAVNGLEHHGALYVYWMALAIAETLNCTRGDLLRVIFSDPQRLDWCRKEGARLAWLYIKAARDEQTALFRLRQETGTKHWRKEPWTARQVYMISLIAVRGDIPMPAVLSCGAAHDWIALNGGHPDFWTAPDAPPAWDIDAPSADGKGA